jgi:hypothetical protein
MRRRTPPILLALVLCTLPAHGADPTQIEIHTLTPIDSLPTKDDIVKLTGPDGVPRLRELALSQTVDFGVQLRAIRALPHFCSPSCKTPEIHPAHAAVLDVLASVPPNDRSGRGILRLRAGIEALGVVKSGQDSDVDLLVPFLGDASRDIRAATARALRDMCNTRAIVPLRARYQVEPTTQAQVRLAISAALRDLGQCPAS